MEKWQELSFNFLFNVSVALIAGGILKLVFDKGMILESVLLLIVGIYSAILIVFGAKYINEKGMKKWLHLV